MSFLKAAPGAARSGTSNDAATLALALERLRGSTLLAEKRRVIDELKVR
jgi:hypothetical protein